MEESGGRKRLRYEDKKKRKVAKDKGESYATYSGHPMPAKELVGLTCKCSYNCSGIVDGAEQQRIFEEFYSLASHDAQNKYLYGLISVAGVKRHTSRESTQPRHRTIVYQVRLADGSHHQVCKKSFCDLHAIGKRRVERLVEKMTQGILIASDMRGKHANRPHAISDDAKEKVREHIKSFPHRQSHYSWSSNLKHEYLDEGLSISCMYLLYQEKCEPQVKESGEVKEWLYRMKKLWLPQMTCLILKLGLVHLKKRGKTKGKRLLLIKRMQARVTSFYVQMLNPLRLLKTMLLLHLTSCKTYPCLH